MPHQNNTYVKEMQFYQSKLTNQHFVSQVENQITSPSEMSLPYAVCKGACTEEGRWETGILLSAIEFCRYDTIAYTH